MKPAFDTFVGYARHWAEARPEAKAFGWLQDGEEETQSLTFRELDLRARAVAGCLQTHYAHAQNVILMFPPGLEFIPAFLGCMYAGKTPVPVNTPKRQQAMEKVRNIIEDCKATVCLSVGELKSDVVAQSDLMGVSVQFDFVMVDGLFSDPATWSGKWGQPDLRRDSIAFLQYTSGSTGNPKGVAVTHGNLIHNQTQIERAFGHDENTSMVGWLPLFHDMGLVGNVLQPIFNGFTDILMAPAAFIQKPIRWLRAISKYGATTSGGPNFGYDLCVRKKPSDGLDDLDLRTWKVAFNGAEPVRAATVESFYNAYASHGMRRTAHFPCYGMAEATLFITGGPHSQEPIVHTLDANALERNILEPLQPAAITEGRSVRRIVGCGIPWLDQEIRIVNPNTFAACPPNEVGEIWVSGGNLSVGYWKDQELTESSFRAYTSDTGQGPYLRTGDLGYLSRMNLFVTGRLKDMIILNGRNHYPHDIEQTSEVCHAAFVAGGAAAFSVDKNGQEALIVFQEIRRSFIRGLDENELGGLLRAAIIASHGINVTEIVFVKEGAVPKTSSGKVRRKACKAVFASGAFERVGKTELRSEAGTRKAMADSR